MDSDKLIALVQEEECLYNFNDRYYHDVLTKEGAWVTIAEQLDQSVQECKRQWTLLRDSLRRNLKKRKTRRGHSAQAIKTWKYENEMSFLLPYLQERSTVSSTNASSSSNDQTDKTALEDTIQSLKNEYVTSATENVLKRRRASNTNNETVERFTLAKIKRAEYSPEKRTEMLEPAASAEFVNYLLEEKDDEVETLFYSLARTVKKMDPYYRAIAKSQVCSVISELEIQNITAGQNPPLLSPETSKAPVSTTMYSPSASSSDELQYSDFVKIIHKD